MGKTVLNLAGEGSEMTKIDLTAIAAALAAHQAEAEGYLRRAGIFQLDTRTTVRVLDPEGWEALDRWAADMVAQAVDEARDPALAWLRHPLWVTQYGGSPTWSWDYLEELTYRPLAVDMFGFKGWRPATPEEAAKEAVRRAERLDEWQRVCSALTLAGSRYQPSVRSRREHPDGRWQSDLWRVTVPAEPSPYGRPRVDERDLALPGEFALSWRAPHQTAPMWAAEEEPIGRVFESEEGHITVFLRADALEVLGISLEEVVAYAVTATGNY